MLAQVPPFLRAGMPSIPCCPSLTQAPSPVAALRVHCVAWALLAFGCQALAQVSTQQPVERGSAPQATRSDELVAPPPYEVTATRSRMLASPASLPRLGGRALNDLAGVTYRVWRSHGSADIGVGVGTLGYLVPAADGSTGGPQALVGVAPAVVVGVRVRVSDEHAVFADAYRARGLGAGPVGIDYGTKVGVEWRPAKSTLGLEHGALGMQLESGYKLSLKVRHGGPSLYLRSQF